MINVDISNIWGQISLPDLLALEAETAAAHQALTEGTGPGSEYRGWLQLPGTEAADEISRILSAAERIQGSSDVLIVLGTGSACLGARAAIELLQGSNRNIGGSKGNPQIFFAGNTLSTRRFQELTHLLEGKDFSLCVISKSGDTLDPAIALRSLKWMLERKYGTDEAHKRIYAITDSSEGALRRMADSEGWETFAIPKDVSSRFSTLTPAGLLPMAAAGIDITELLHGAAEAAEAFNLRSYENPVWLYAACRNLMYRSGKGVELLESFEPGFRMMGQWWQQLFAPSGGKGLFPAAAELPADLYALGQNNLFTTMIRFDPPEQRVTIGEDVRNLDELNYLAGKQLDFVEDLVCQGTMDALVDAGISVITIECGQLRAGTLGALFCFFSLSSAISAYILGVDPFVQPDVDRHRQNIFTLLGKPTQEDA